MLIKKWDNKKQQYEPHEVPDEWKLPLFCEDMDEPINCVNCGCEMPFGDGYTSRRYHTNGGFGYYECAKCYFAYLEGTEE